MFGSSLCSSMSFSHSLQMYCNKALPTFKLFIPHTTPSYSASSASFSSMVIPCNLLALQGSDHFNSTSLTSDNFPFIVDSGCTIAASSNLDDFKPCHTLLLKTSLYVASLLAYKLLALVTSTGHSLINKTSPQQCIFTLFTYLA